MGGVDSLEQEAAAAGNPRGRTQESLDVDARSHDRAEVVTGTAAGAGETDIGHGQRHPSVQAPRQARERHEAHQLAALTGTDEAETRGGLELFVPGAHPRGGLEVARGDRPREASPVGLEPGQRIGARHDLHLGGGHGSALRNT